MEILSFFRAVRFVLKDGGVFLFQIVNYDRILDNRIDRLPTIENDYIRFERKYIIQSDSGNIKFDTHLLVKENSNVIDNSVFLLPIRKTRLLSLLGIAGFNDVKSFGSFTKEDYSEDSLALVAYAKI